MARQKPMLNSKKALKALTISGTNSKDVNIKLHEFLFCHRNAKHTVTNRAPADILFGKNLRCRLEQSYVIPACRFSTI